LSAESPGERDGFERLVPRHEGAQGFPKLGPERGVGGRSCVPLRGGDGLNPRPRERRPTRRDGFVGPARISLSRETEGSKTVSSIGPASAAVLSARASAGTQVNFAFRAPSAEYVRSKQNATIRRDKLIWRSKRDVGGNEMNTLVTRRNGIKTKMLGRGRHTRRSLVRIVAHEKREAHQSQEWWSSLLCCV